MTKEGIKEFSQRLESKGVISETVRCVQMENGKPLPKVEINMGSILVQRTASVGIIWIHSHIQIQMVSIWGAIGGWKLHSIELNKISKLLSNWTQNWKKKWYEGPKNTSQSESGPVWFLFFEIFSAVWSLFSIVSFLPCLWPPKHDLFSEFFYDFYDIFFNLRMERIVKKTKIVNTV